MKFKSRKRHNWPRNDYQRYSIHIKKTTEKNKFPKHTKKTISEFHPCLVFRKMSKINRIILGFFTAFKTPGNFHFVSWLLFRVVILKKHVAKIS